MNLRCYCCGEPIEGTFALVSMQPNSVDRVFVAKLDHLENFDIGMSQSLMVAPVKLS